MNGIFFCSISVLAPAQILLLAHASSAGLGKLFLKKNFCLQKINLFVCSLCAHLIMTQHLNLISTFVAPKKRERRSAIFLLYQNELGTIFFMKESITQKIYYVAGLTFCHHNCVRHFLLWRTCSKKKYMKDCR